MKYLPITLTLLLAFVTSDAQVNRSGGIFGFGRNKEQINPGLFPDSTPTAPMQISAPVSSAPAPSAPQTSAPTPPPRTSDNIFRGGAPAEIESEVSYVIEDGQKVEKSDSEKKPLKFLGFGKKEKSGAAVDSPALDPVPEPTYPDPANAVAETSAPAPPYTAPVEVEKPAEASGGSPLQSIAEEVTAAVNGSPEMEAAEKKPGMFSFFNRKEKKESSEPVIAPQPVFTEATETVSTGVAMQEETASDPVPASTPAPSTPTPDSPEPAPVAADPVPRFASVDTPKKEKSGFGIPSLPNPMKNLKPPPNPIKAIRPPKKEKTIDLTGAETIISNGEIVDEQDDMIESNIVQSDAGTREPPRIVNGVKTYSSWDDVGGRSVSAADRILDQIR